MHNIFKGQAVLGSLTTAVFAVRPNQPWLQIQPASSAACIYHHLYIKCKEVSSSSHFPWYATWSLPGWEAIVQHQRSSLASPTLTQDLWFAVPVMCCSRQILHHSWWIRIIHCGYTIRNMFLPKPHPIMKHQTLNWKTQFDTSLLRMKPLGILEESQFS